MLDLIWTAADASDYLPSEALNNKLTRVLKGLKALQRGEAAKGLPPDDDKLRMVAEAIAARLVEQGAVDSEVLNAAFARDGFQFDGRELTGARPPDEPADRLAAHVGGLFGERAEFDVGRNHYEQANRAFDRGDWEAANAQFRSACDAVYDVLAHSNGCPVNKAGGSARQWLQTQGLLEADEADLVRTFMAFAGRAGSHAGLSGAADAQLRRHFATALIAFAVAKLG